jgi:hypothetical protein
VSQAGRAAHAHNKNRHAQRAFGVEKAKLAPADQANLWVGEFVSSAQGLTTHLTVNSLLAVQLGATEQRRMERLRVLSKMGILRMYAHREGDKFIEYRWELTREGDLSPR